MKKFKSWLFKIVTPHGLAAVLVVLAFNFLVYQGTRLFNTGMDHLDMTLPFDETIPFISAFILIYVPVAFSQWIFGFILVARQEKKICYRICASEMIAKFICLLCFILIPTTMPRPETVGNDFFGLCVQLMYKLDPSDNLFPSIHCLESYILCRAMFWMKGVPKWFKAINIPVTILVFASTLFLKQHVFVDLVAAVAVVEIGLFVTGLFKQKFNKY